MYEYDYSGDMKFFQDQLAAKGITKKMLDRKSTRLNSSH